jgi:hypothetical protein
LAAPRTLAICVRLQSCLTTSPRSFVTIECDYDGFGSR